MFFSVKAVKGIRKYLALCQTIYFSVLLFYLREIPLPDKLSIVRDSAVKHNTSLH